MKKFTFLFFSFVCLSTNAQNWLWAKGTADGGGGGGAGDNVCVSVSADAGGNVFVTGIFQSPTLTFGSITLTNAGGGNGYAHDIFIAKYDASGNILWAKSVGGTGDDGSFSVSADAGGNVFVTGWFVSSTITFGVNTLTNTNYGADIFIAKYDANGNVLWAKSAGGVSDEYGNSVSADTNGNVFVTGYFWSPTITFGSTTLTNAGDWDVFIAKYDSNGNVLWAKSATGTSNDVGSCVSADAGGNVFVTGSFQSPNITFGSTTLTNSGGSCYMGCYDVFIAKYDANGNVLWAKSAGGTNYYDWGYSVSADASGNMFVTGCFQSPTITFGSTTLTNAGVGAWDIFIAKYDAIGNVLWAKRAGGASVDYCYSISTDANGNVFITGWFNNPTITFGTITLSGNIGFIAKYDGNGDVLCASTIPEAGKGVSADSYGNAYIGGGFIGSTFILGTDTLTTTGGMNVFVAKYRCEGHDPTAVNELSNEEGISVYPNPSYGIFTIQIRNCPAGAKVTVRDMFGNCLLEKSCRSETSQEINLSCQPRGIYFVEVLSGEERVVKKVAVQ